MATQPDDPSIPQSAPPPPPPPGVPSGAGADGQFRRQPRSGGRLAVRYAAPGGAHAGEVRQGTTLNIGTGGAFIEADDPLSPGTRINLEVLLPPDGSSVALAGEVRWVRTGAATPPHGMGVLFRGAEPAPLERLHEYVTSLLATIDHDEAP